MITRDNIPIQITGLLFYQIIDPVSVVLNIVGDVDDNIKKLGSSLLLDAVNTNTLKQLLENKQNINNHIYEDIKRSVINWGVQPIRIEIKNIAIIEKEEEKTLILKIH